MRKIILVVLITIIILIILAGITINAVVGDSGLIYQARNSKEMSSNEIAETEENMNKVMTEYANMMAEDSEIPVVDIPTTVEEGKESGKSFDNTTIIKDDLDNDVTIPGGFHIAEDSGTKVEEGIVIEDLYGYQ